MNIQPILQKKENPAVVQIPLGRNDENLDDEVIRYDTENKRFFTDNTSLSLACMISASIVPVVEDDEEGEQ
jgi:hypothetical protein